MRRGLGICRSVEAGSDQVGGTGVDQQKFMVVREFNCIDHSDPANSQCGMSFPSHFA
jgi:hypothetical protein